MTVLWTERVPNAEMRRKSQSSQEEQKLTDLRCFFKGPKNLQKISCFVAENDNIFHLQHDFKLVTHVIIGSGISGLTIASGLISSGVDKNDILILEARDRIGGRVLTGAPKACGAKLDCGAAWIHGSVNNPLNELLLRVDSSGSDAHGDCNNHSLKTKVLVPVADSNPWMHSEDVPVRLFLGKNGEAPVDEEKRQKMASIWNEIACDIGDSCVEKTITDAFSEYVQSSKCTLSESDISDLISFLTLVEVWSGGSAKTLSSSFLSPEANKTYNKSLFGDYEGPHSLFAKGAIGLVDALVKSCGVDYTDRILYNQIATEIIRDESAGGLVEIRTNEGRVFRCNNLCVTIPPGPLKNIIFSPPLNEAKIEAINRVKMGSYKKIQLEFAAEDVFWSQNDAKSPLIITRNFSVDPVDFYLKKSYNQDKVEGTLTVSDLGPYLLWDNYVSLKGYPILEAICPADLGWKLVGKSDEEIVDVVLDVLRMHYPEVPEPTGCVITRWEEDVFSQGAYSYHTVDSRDSDAQVVYENINQQIFFAGEHTDPVFYGSLNAAFHSGVRVLNELGFCKVTEDPTLFANSDKIFLQILQFLPEVEKDIVPSPPVAATTTAADAPACDEKKSSLFPTERDLSKPLVDVSDVKLTSGLVYPGPQPYMYADGLHNVNAIKALRACLVPSFVDSIL